MDIEQRHALNHIRREITAIEIELMPNPGEEIDVMKVDHHKRNIASKLEGIMIALEGTG